MASKLLRIAPFEAENQFEISLRQAFELFEPKLKPPFPLTIPDREEYSQLNRAFLYGVLGEPRVAKTHIKHLHAVVSDGYGLFVNLLVKIVNELYEKLVESAKIQLIWVTKEIIDVWGIGIDGLLVCLLRQIVGGDYSEGNLWLCFELVSVFTRKWDLLLEEEPMILTSALYTYLRLLAEHCRLPSNAKLEELKRMEIGFCVRILREQFHLCIKIGRDLVRLLQDLAHVPEFQAIWKDLQLHPSEFRTPGFSDISQIYSLRTSSRYILLRITPEMETKLRFLLTHVRLGRQRRHQAWFARKFLNGQEKEILVSDIVRFICCAHHPPNEIIQSDIVPRWAVIGWLLKSCRKNYEEANAKLALLYDWLFFDERVDNIMNIEPAMLLMVYSIPKYIDMTHSVLELLFLLVDNYDMERKSIIVKSVSSAFSILVRKGVVHSIDVLTSCDLLSPILKERLERFMSVRKEGSFKEFQPLLLGQSTPPLGLPNLSCLGTPKPSPRGPPTCTQNRFDPKHLDASVPISGDLELAAHLSGHSVPPFSLPDSSCVGALTPASKGQPTTPRDDSLPISGDMLPSCSATIVTSNNQVDAIELLVNKLGEKIKKSHKTGLRALEEILLLFVKLDSQKTANDSTRPEVLAGKVAKGFEVNEYKLFTPLNFRPDDPESEDNVGSATALIVRIFIFSQHQKMQEMLLYWSKNGFPVGAWLLSYASRLAVEACKAGYSRNAMYDNNSTKINDSGMPLLIFHVNGYFSFLNGEQTSHEDIVSISKIDHELVTKLVDCAFAAYRCFLMYSRMIMHKEDITCLSKLLYSDLVLCSEWEVKQLKFLLSVIFCHLPDLSIGEKDIIKLLVDRLDHTDLVDIQFSISLKRFSIFGENTDNILHLIKHSLSWTCLEQHKFWSLIRSELVVSKVQIEKILKAFFCSEEVDGNACSIAAEGLLSLCSCLAPKPELVGAVILLPNNEFRDFSAAVLSTWGVSNSSMLFDSLQQFSEKFDNNNEDSDISNSPGITINHSAILWLLNSFNAQGTNSSSILSKLSIHTPDNRSNEANMEDVR